MSKPGAKTKAQLIAELEILNRRVAELEAVSAECRQAEAALRESEGRYRRITQTLTDYIYTVRVENGRAVETTHGPGCVAVTGYTSEDFAANPDLWLDMVVEEARPAVLELARRLLDGEDIQPLEHRITRKDGVKRWVRNTPVPHRDPQGKIVSYDGLIQDITERKQTGAKLAETQVLLTSAIEQSPSPMVVARPDGIVTIFNQACLEMLGIEDEPVAVSETNILTMKRSWQDLETDGTPIPPHESPLALALQGKATKGKEMKVRRKDGTERWEVADGVPIYDKDGNLIAGLAVFPDITERKQAEEALRKREAHQALVLDSLPMAFYVAQPSGDYGGLWVSAQVDRIAGFTATQFAEDAHLWASRLHPEDRERVLALFEGLSNTDSLRFEYRWQAADGKYRWLLDQAVLIRDESGHPKEVIGTWLDITERKRMEDALRDSEAKMRSIFGAAPVGIGLVVNRVIAQANDRLCEMTGYSREELIGQNSRILYPSDEDYTYVGQEKYRQISEHGTGSVETRWQRKDGTIIQILLSSTPLNADDLSAGVTFTALDITDRKQAQEALAQERNLLRTLIDSMPDHIYAKDTKGRFTLKNEADARDMGANSPGEVIGKTDFDYYPREFAERFFADDMQVVRSGQPLINREEPGVDPHGNWRWVLTTKVPLRDSHGKVTGLVGVGRDITDRKRAEEALKESEGRYRAMIESQVDLVSRYLPDTTLTFVNDAYCRFFGKTREELIGRSYLFMIAPESRDLVKKETEDLAKNPRPLAGEYLNYRKDGKECWIQWVVQCITGENGQVVELQAVGRDITNRKRAEEELRIAEAQLSNAVKMAHLGPWELDIDKDLFTFNDYFYAIFHTTAEEVGGYTMPRSEYGRRFIHPDDALVVVTENQKAIETTDPDYSRQLEHRVVYADGGVGYISVQISIVKDDKGRTVKTYGVNQDITERKRADEALRASEEKYRLLFQSNPVPMWVYDTDTLAFLAVNEFAVDHYGYSRDEFLSMTIRDIRPPEDVPYLHEVLNNYTGQLRKAGLARHRKKDGSLIDVEITGHEIEFEGHQAMLVLALDITERRRAEEEIVLYREHLEELVGQRTAELKSANEQLLVLTRLKDEFVSNVSHELHTPISSLKLRQHLLEKHPDRLDEHLSVIRRETDRLARTIEDLLQLSRLDQRRIEFHPVQIDLNTLAAQYVSDRLPIADSKSLTLSFQGEPGLPDITADAGLVGQALSVLLTNAISYTPAGGRVTVRTHARQDTGGRWVGFSVTDTGPGISPEERRQLFTRFFRGGAARRSGVPGTGLGLAIAQEIINRHGGSIEVESDGVPGKGATFSVWMPIGRESND